MLIAVIGRTQNAAETEVRECGMHIEGQSDINHEKDLVKEVSEGRRLGQSFRIKVVVPG